MNVSIVIPFYRQPAMLRKQIDNWASYSDKARQNFTLVVIDDGSPEPASDVIKAIDGVRLYRIAVDRPWNRNVARNLGAHVCETEWLLNIDADHLLPPESADALLETEVSSKYWWRFPRWRVGRADETRRKDQIGEDVEFGQIHEHIDSHLMTREMFLKSPYDQRFTGFLGGGSPFLKRMGLIAPCRLLPDNVCLHVYTRHAVPDASVTTLSRDTSQYSKARREIERSGVPPRIVLDYEWSRVL